MRGGVERRRRLRAVGRRIARDVGVPNVIGICRWRRRCGRRRTRRIAFRSIAVISALTPISAVATIAAAMAITPAATAFGCIACCRGTLRRAHHAGFGRLDRGKRRFANRYLLTGLARRTWLALRLAFALLTRWTGFALRTLLALLLPFAAFAPLLPLAAFARLLSFASLSFALLLPIARLLTIAALSRVLLRLRTPLLRVARLSLGALCASPIVAIAPAFVAPNIAPVLTAMAITLATLIAPFVRLATRLAGFARPLRHSRWRWNRRLGSEP
jgi:hypothetical protein